MTPQERQLIDDLFDVSTGLPAREHPARMAKPCLRIMQGLRNAPHAVYALSANRPGAIPRR